ncbi:transcriptional regulator, DeoR family [Mariniphaga anaerophila]|uniref:Transcriptional regulator, DeoR family n=1 Tax=Mariniphaga anaerophila TaxID=1484053 RepID=A0A1M5E0A9_9BACT|nr:DeoR/GlpR family DNA-binding transcription regulator [Mariniphaga anaerophila]SHF72698.1 transcriptional regulator, DeoR family [Mariniphaga anaerophila]
MKESSGKRNSAQRHRFILNEMEKQGYVRVQDISEQIGVSEVTIRKDLKELESRKLLVRSHGGASPLSSLINDRHIDEKEKIMVEEKLRIADAANLLVKKDDRIIIASGTTLLYFARKISMTEPLTVITPSVKVSLTLCYNPNIEIIQLGGAMRKSSATVIGPYAEQFLSGLMCNKLFIGVDGIDIDFGLTTSNIGEAHLNQYMLDAAKEVIVLADSSKFGKQGFGKICNIDRIHHIITDKNAPASALQMIREKGIKVTLV